MSYDVKIDTLCVDDSQNELLGSIKERVERMAVYFGRTCSVDSDDLAQDAWVAVLEMLPRLDGSIGAADQHLIKRARWRMLDSIRSHSRRRHLCYDDLEMAAAAPDVAGNIDVAMLIETLPVMQQRILRALMEGYTWREVGKLVGCSSANVAYHVRKIREVYNTLFAE